MTSARVVVTGAAGFLGAATARRLLARGHAVLAWIRPGSDPWRLNGISGPLELLHHDVRDVLEPGARAALAAALGRFRPDAVIHAAWRGVRGASRDEAAQLENVPVAVEVLRLGAEAGARRLVGLGSQAEYGPKPSVITEATPACPATYYGAAKLAACHLTLATARQLGVSAAWARVFSVYGPGQREGALIPDLGKALRAGRPYELGPGETRWDFLYEDDAGDAIADLALQPAAVGLFNVASGSAVQIREVVHRVAQVVAPHASPRLGERAPSGNDLPRLEADVAKLRDATGWRPVVALEQGIARALSFVL